MSDRVKRPRVYGTTRISGLVTQSCMDRIHILNDDPDIIASEIPQDTGIPDQVDGPQKWPTKGQALRIPRVINFYYDAWEQFDTVGDDGDPMNPFGLLGGPWRLKSDDSFALLVFYIDYRFGSLTFGDPVLQEAYCSTITLQRFTTPNTDPPNNNKVGIWTAAGGGPITNVQAFSDTAAFGSSCLAYPPISVFTIIRTDYTIRRTWQHRQTGQIVIQNGIYVDLNKAGEEGVIPRLPSVTNLIANRPSGTPRGQSLDGGSKWLPAITAYQSKFDNKVNFFFAKKYNQTINIPKLLMPKVKTSFFGVKLLNIILLSYDYGWENGSYSPEDMTVDIQAFKEVYQYYANHETWIFLDYGFAEAVDKVLQEKHFVSHMNSVEGTIQTLCSSLMDYGFRYGGRVNYKDPNFDIFEDKIMKFYNLTNPP